MIRSYKKLLCIFLLASPAMHAIESQGIEQFNPNELQFRAADKWSDGTAFAVGGAIGAVVGFACAAGNAKTLGQLGAGIAVGGVIGGGIEVWHNGRYTAAYDAAGGKNINGAAAANNAQGVQAWLNYGNSAIAQDNDKMTPLMYAAANGSYEAARVVADNMPTEYEVVESTEETETVKTERGSRAQTWDNLLYPETTKSKSVRKKMLETASMRSSNGRTAIHWAFYGEHYKLLLYLIERGKANGNIEDNRGRSVKNMQIGGKSLSDVLDEAAKRGLSRTRQFPLYKKYKALGIIPWSLISCY